MNDIGFPRQAEMAAVAKRGRARPEALYERERMRGELAQQFDVHANRITQ